MKKLIALALSSVLVYTANAQDNETASANQSVSVSLENVIELAFTANESSTGPNVSLTFATINDYANGVESAAQELRVRSNKGFFVKVKTGSEFFGYVGNAFPSPNMPVDGVLGLKVTANATGGNIDFPFSTVSYASLRDFDQFLLGQCTAGDNKTFSVSYKATPGFVYPAGAVLYG